MHIHTHTCLCVYVCVCVLCCAKQLQSCPTLCDPMDCSLPSSFVHGILQAKILEWIAVPSPGDLPNLGIEPASLISPALAGSSLSLALPGKPYRQIQIQIYVYRVRQRQRERQRIIHIIIFCKVLVNTKLLLLGEIQDMVPASFRSQHSPQPINTQPCFMPISVEYLILMLIY